MQDKNDLSMKSLHRMDKVDFTDIFEHTSHHADSNALDKSEIPFVTSYIATDRPKMPAVSQISQAGQLGSIDWLIEKIRSRKGYTENIDLEHLTMNAARAVVQFNNE